MKKTVLLASLLAAIALTACGKKEEAAAPAAAPAVEAAKDAAGAAVEAAKDAGAAAANAGAAAADAAEPKSARRMARRRASCTELPAVLGMWTKMNRRPRDRITVAP